jgi:hypothetical protein
MRALTHKQETVLRNLLALVVSAVFIAQFVKYIDYRDFLINRYFILLDGICWMLLLLACATFFLVANNPDEPEDYLVLSGLMVNFSSIYIFLFVLRLATSGFYTDSGPLVDLGFNKEIFTKVSVLVSFSYVLFFLGLSTRSQASLPETRN